jgi:polyferredoxin
LAPEPRRRLRWPTRSWTHLRKAIQAVALLSFLTLFVWSRRGGWPPSVVNVPMRLDPLAMLAHLLSSRTLFLGSALALLVVVLTLVAGRVWCGWLCPLGTLLDLFSLHRWRTSAAQPAESWRKVKHGLLLTAMAAALFTNLTLLIFDPLTILFRTLSVAVWPAVDQIITVAEATGYRVEALRPAIAAFEGLVRPKILPPYPAFYRYTLLYAGAFLGIVALNLAARRFWCRYLCPLGAFLGLVSKVAILRRTVNDRCRECDACARVCPTATIDRAMGYGSDPAECTMCLECVVACPYDAIDFKDHLSLAPWRPYDPSRRQALIALGAALAGVGLFRSSRSAFRDDPFVIRPPGARENDLPSKCIRCGECIRACPTSAIQPSVAEAGLQGLWTPVLVPRLGYCDYSCNACGQVCPVQAIPPLSLEEKRQQVIGQAYIDQNRCIPWSDYRPCIVCEEMCPVPEKAIKLEEVEVVNPDGAAVTLQRPRVVRERCIGCGICEYKCPVNGEAAIRVYVPSTGL